MRKLDTIFTAAEAQDLANEAEKMKRSTLVTIPGWEGSHTKGTDQGGMHTTSDHNHRLGYYVLHSYCQDGSGNWYNRIYIDIYTADETNIQERRRFIYPQGYGSASGTLRVLVHEYMRQHPASRKA